jgi:hypothetical protein
MALTDGFFALSENINKVSESDSSSSISNLLPELTLQMDDAELLALKRDWMKAWEPYEAEIKQIQDQNEEYWLGKQFGCTEGPIDNLVFESLETFLPIATRPKADPLVESDNTEEGNAVADKVRKMLGYVSDTLSYNLKLKQVARFWALYLLGVMKVGWSEKEDDITCVALRPQKLILDPTATIEECEYQGYYIGEHMEDIASDLVARFPGKAELIKNKVHNKMGTKVPYILWTTDDYLFWTMDEEVLDKIKNPHWNYDTTTEPRQSVDEFGMPVEVPGEPVEGINHFKSRKKPYIFLSIFSIGKRPHDATNLIKQNIPLQDLINKRLKQIDHNADNANGGIAVSGDAFTEEQAASIAQKRRKGATLWIPSGSVDAAVMDLPAHPLPTFIYESLQDYRNEVRNIFGTRGSTPQGILREKTLGGKEIIKQQDTDRIGGGISKYLEEFSDCVFNWFVQLMYVYYDEPHYASVLGAERAKEYIELMNTDLASVKLLVGVKEGSMIPTDPQNQREEAVALWQMNGIDPITFFDRLEFPNPREAAKQLYLWQNDPISLFPDLQAEQQQQMLAEQEAAMQEQTAASEAEQAKELLATVDQQELAANQAPI